MKVLIFSPGKHIHRNYILTEPVAKLYLPSILKRNLKTKHSGHCLEHSISTVIIIIYIYIVYHSYHYYSINFQWSELGSACRSFRERIHSTITKSFSFPELSPRTEMGSLIRS